MFVILQFFGNFISKFVNLQNLKTLYLSIETSIKNGNRSAIDLKSKLRLGHFLIETIEISIEGFIVYTYIFTLYLDCQNEFKKKLEVERAY